jgi:hypothetical protein
MFRLVRDPGNVPGAGRFLRYSSGRVLCGCFKYKTNLNPPDEVTFGTNKASPVINMTANWVFQQGLNGEAIPVFIKLHRSEVSDPDRRWKFQGDYKCVGLTRDKKSINRAMNENPHRPDGRIHGILHFERARDV